MPDSLRFYGVQVAYVMARVFTQRLRNIVQVDFPLYNSHFQGWIAQQCDSQLLVYPPDMRGDINRPLPDITAPASLAVHQLVPETFFSIDQELCFAGYLPDESRFKVDTLGQSTYGFQPVGVSELLYVDLDKRLITETIGVRFPYIIYNRENIVFQAGMASNGERIFLGQCSVVQQNPRHIRF
jgi:hypothetical protein